MFFLTWSWRYAGFWEIKEKKEKEKKKPNGPSFEVQRLKKEGIYSVSCTEGQCGFFKKTLFLLNIQGISDWPGLVAYPSPQGWKGND